MVLHTLHKTVAGHQLAYRTQPGDDGVGVLFLCGLRSDMDSTKATALAEYCAAQKIPLTLFDYFAHGKSEGDFMDYTIGRGVEDALEILDHIATGPQIVVGSSMGGWIGLHAALQRKHQVRAYIGIAAAPDFTETIPPQMTADQKATFEADGVVWAPSDYGSDWPITKPFIENGREMCLLDDTILLDIPVHLLQGQQDPDVPWDTAPRIAERLMSEDVVVTLIKDGAHSLSRPQDLPLLFAAVDRMRALTA